MNFQVTALRAAFVQNFILIVPPKWKAIRNELSRKMMEVVEGLFQPLHLLWWHFKIDNIAENNSSS